MDWVVGSALTVHLVTAEVESLALTEQTCPQTLMEFFDGSPCTRDVSRPAWLIETWQPPAKEQETALSIEVTERAFDNLAVEERVAKI